MPTWWLRGKFSWQCWWHHPLCVWARVLITLGLVVWALVQGGQHLGYQWQWRRLWPFIGGWENGSWQPGPLLWGLGVTIEVSCWALAGAVVVAFVLALMRISPSPLARVLARCILEVVRNTPFIVQIFLFYFVIAPFVGLERLPTAIIALALFEGTYASEIIRAGILAVPQGQWEAGRSLGIGPWPLWTRIILPQAMRTVLPALINQAVSLIKDSALVSTIAVYDLSMRAQAIVAETFLVFEVWFTVAALYLVLTGSLAWCAAQIQGSHQPNSLPGGLYVPHCSHASFLRRFSRSWGTSTR